MSRKTEEMRVQGEKRLPMPVFLFMVLTSVAMGVFNFAEMLREEAHPALASFSGIVVTVMLFLGIYLVMDILYYIVFMKAVRKELGLPKKQHILSPTITSYWEKTEKGTRFILRPSYAEPTAQVYRLDTKGLVLIPHASDGRIWDATLKTVQDNYTN